MSAALTIRGLRIGYRPAEPVVDGIDLDVGAGECLALVGESGCGKTTIARAVLGLLPKRAWYEGSVRLGADELLDRSARRMRELLGTRLGYVAQDPYAACDPLRSVGHHVAEAWTARGSKPPRDAVTRRLTALHIPEARTRAADRPHQWSGGMLQRASISAATAHRPALIVADEPTSALDAELADDVLATLREHSTGLLLISHDLALVAAHADRIAVLQFGTIVESGPARQVMADPQHDYTRLLLGTARASRIRPVRPVATTPVVSAENVCVTYRSGRTAVRAVDNVSLTVHPGEVVGIAGPSGSGKSTLLRVLGGIEQPASGAVWFGAAGRPRPGYVMPVFQDPVASLDRRWPIWRSITEPVAAQRRLDRAERMRLARAALDRVRLGGLDPDRLPGQLSVGQCQRVAIARAVIGRPALLVADEPTASLDVTSAMEAVELFRELADDGIAIAVVSHDPGLLAALCDRVIRIRDGTLIGQSADGELVG